MLPPGPVGATTPITDASGLYAEEARCVAGSVAKRRREFAAGRRCARAALNTLGCPSTPILQGPLGEPQWPNGFGGSIAHSARLAVAVAYRKAGSGTSYGVDLVDEPSLAVFDELGEVILSPIEHVSDGSTPTDRRTLAEVFSAKEAAIKLLGPRIHRHLDFSELIASRTGRGWIVSGPEGKKSEVVTMWVDGILLTVGQASSR
jgi:4'-phosphopantetheinyl transferase EntD